MRINREATSGQTPAAINSLTWTLPPALVDKAASRLCWISIVSAVSTIFMFAAWGFLQAEVRAISHLPVIRLTVLAVVLLCLGYIGLSRSGLLSKQGLLNVGVFFQVVVAFGFSMLENAVPHDHAQVVRGVSAVTVWLALCGLLIPNTPLVVLTGSLASASMYPLAHYICADIIGYEPLPANRLAVWMVPLVLMAVWSYFLNKRIFAMQIQAQRAEDLGSYQLDTRIGYGGMGEVWRARHRFLARDAAVKLIRTEALMNQSGKQAAILRKRFELEAKTTASLSSPHTVALYDFGITQDRSFYYVMELLDGVDLQSLVERYGTLPPNRVIHVLRQVCDSLEEAHRAGLVHRDIKPKNIVLCRLGLEYDFAKVLDFGLVKNNQRTDSTLMTLDGTATGTPAFMPPEIAMGENEIDGRADLYSLGCVAYYLLTGTLVFNESTPTALALAHVQKPPVPPSERTEVRIPRELDELVLKLLAKKPEDRPRSAQEVGRILDSMPLARWSRTDASEWWMTNLPDTPTAPVLRVTPSEAQESAGALETI